MNLMFGKNIKNIIIIFRKFSAGLLVDFRYGPQPAKQLGRKCIPNLAKGRPTYKKN